MYSSHKMPLWFMRDALVTRQMDRLWPLLEVV
jgi:hypothetical protein